MPNCPLCYSQISPKYAVYGNSGAKFWFCSICKLISRSSKDLPARKVEQERYLSHNNSINDKRYVKFLLRPYEFACKHIPIQEPILDYGCGYAPIFVELMHRRQFRCHGYDPLFFPDGLLANSYPTIFCIETVEHFHQTHREWSQLMDLMRPGGYLIIMTDFWNDRSAFPDWYYQNDPTHVSFYHTETMPYLSQRFDRPLVATDGRRISIFHRKFI